MHIYMCVLRRKVFICIAILKYVKIRSRKESKTKEKKQLFLTKPSLTYDMKTMTCSHFEKIRDLLFEMAYKKSNQGWPNLMFFLHVFLRDVFQVYYEIHIFYERFSLRFFIFYRKLAILALKILEIILIFPSIWEGFGKKSEIHDALKVFLKNHV